MSQIWSVRWETGERRVEAADWMGALAVAVPDLGLRLDCLVCAELEDGGAVAQDTTSGVEIWVTPGMVAAEAVPEPIPAASAARAEASAEADPLADDVEMALFLQLGALSSARGIAEASAIALRTVLEYVPAGAGAVLIRTHSGDGLRFRATSGPMRQKLIDTVIPLDRGIAGYVTQLGIGICVKNARRDPRHDDHVDRSTGYTTRSLLAVPVRAATGAAYGCLELLNPSREFTGADFEIATRVAASLGVLIQSVDAPR
jgi:GAF domain-containing protein